MYVQSTSDRLFSASSVQLEALSSATNIEYPAPGMDAVPLQSTEGYGLLFLCAVGAVFMILQLLLTSLCLAHRYGRMSCTPADGLRVLFVRDSYRVTGGTC